MEFKFNLYLSYDFCYIVITNISMLHIIQIPAYKHSLCLTLRHSASFKVMSQGVIWIEYHTTWSYILIHVSLWILDIQLSFYFICDPLGDY